MAVSWVAGTSLTQATGTSVAATAPAGLTSGDILLAGIYARSTITPPSGWTQVDLTADFTDGTVSQRLAVYRKNSTTSGDSSASFTWSQASSAPIGVAYAAARGASSTISTAKVTYDDPGSGALSFEPASIVANANGQLIVIFASVTESDPVDPSTPVAPAGMTLFTQSSALPYRMAGAYRTANNGQGGPFTDFLLDDEFSTFGAFGAGAISLLLDLAPASSYEGIIQIPGPLGGPSIVGQTAFGGRISLPSPLGQPAVRGYSDIGGAINSDGAAVYFMDLVTPGGDVRVPISSWQATLRTETSQYVQCVIPACAAYVSSIEDATSFRLSRRLTLNTGATLDYLITEAPLAQIQYARGSTNYTATISGYLAAAEDITWPPGTARTLTGIRTVFTYSSGLRIRCSIDWLLQPGQSATYGDTTFTVSFITYIVGEGDSMMDVGEDLET